jgi:NAD(P)-dependent dehydrogenase (short-subunit alcohol dehydrogenase family)
MGWRKTGAKWLYRKLDSKEQFCMRQIYDEGVPLRLVQLALDTFGKVDAIVNNAAIVASSNIHNTDKNF